MQPEQAKHQPTNQLQDKIPDRIQDRIQFRIDELELGLVADTLSVGHRPLAFVSQQLLHMVAPLVELLGYPRSHLWLRAAHDFVFRQHTDSHT